MPWRQGAGQGQPSAILCTPAGSWECTDVLISGSLEVWRSRKARPSMPFHFLPQKGFPMIDCQAVAGGFFAVAAAAPSRTHAARSLDPLAASLREKLLMPLGANEPAARLRAIDVMPLSGSEGPAEVAKRLEFRLGELGLAKRFGEAADVRRVAEMIVNELRDAAMAKVRR